ncbi:glycosyltransferase family 4 protein [Phycicoccus sp. BSK3Z-2]|uniref:D-inositol 3-phosphate glycosyltransferase n=1 Tax=Phycicoccus avicenniae TaxID=2828860 RepID=A0A941D5Q0_9MICO|nr:glycosyltransferase family 4 protein [Phycicoccus avicenniae]MBR7742599.1 glycosyltransferase family 4 protein [Phycicoccus avicenniae]
MRVLLLTHYYAPEVGAPQHRWSALARVLTGLGHELHVLAPPPHYPGGRVLPAHAHLRPGTTATGEHGETVHRVAFRPHTGAIGGRVADEVVVAADVVRRGRSAVLPRPDVVVATAPPLPMLGAGGRLARRLGVPFVAELRDAWPDLLDVADQWSGEEPSRLRRGLHGVSRRARGGVASVLTRQQRRADAVVVTTDTFAEVLRGRDVPTVHVVRNAAHGVSGYAEHVPRVPTAELRVLHAGTMGRSQGLGTAVRAAALAADRGVPVRLRLVGAGAERDRLARLAAELRAPVDVVGPVPHATMGEHYAWADTALVTLRAWPALEWTVPSKLYEVMGLGIHVTAAVGGEAAEIVAGREAGTVSAPEDVAGLADAWERLAADRELLRVPATGRAWAAEHAGTDALGRAYADLLEAVVAGAR